MKDKKQQSLKVLASTAVAMPMLTVNSEADIIVDSSLAGTVISWNNTPSASANLFGSVGFNINTRATMSGGVPGGSTGYVGVLAAWNGSGGKFRHSGNFIDAALLGAAGDTFNAVGLGSGEFANINLGYGYSSFVYSNYGNSPFSSGDGPKYLMFKFDNSGIDNFGWLEITSMTGSGLGRNDYSATLGNFAYDNSGAPLANGAIPEPSSVALMMCAMVGGACLLRRAREQRAS